MKFIDLSVSINEDTPVYPGDPQIKITTAGILGKDGYEDHYICLGTHAGTHVDAPRHMVAGGKGLDEIPVEHFYGNGVYIKIDGKFDLKKIQQVSIQEGDIVLFHTGMSEVYYQSDYFKKYPAMSEEVANFLVAKGVKVVGVDMCSPDYEPFPVHRILLKNNVLIIENLTNLASMSGKKFKVYAFPIKLQIDGAPVRVVAEVL